MKLNDNDSYLLLSIIIYFIIDINEIEGSLTLELK